MDPKARVVVVFYSLYTHTYQLAQAIVEGARSVEGVAVDLYQVPEILSPAYIKKMGAVKAKEAMESVPVLTHELQGNILKQADAIIFGSPTRFGAMTSQMKAFFDGLGGLWYENAFVGKLGSCFGGSGTQHGGQETTLMTMITAMMHLGLLVVGLPYSCNAQKMSSEVTGGTPYGSTHIASTDGSRAVTDNERECARFQGRHVALLALQLRAGRASTDAIAVELDEKSKSPKKNGGKGKKNVEKKSEKGGKKGGKGTKKNEKPKKKN